MIDETLMMAETLSGEEAAAYREYRAAIRELAAAEKTLKAAQDRATKAMMALHQFSVV